MFKIQHAEFLAPGIKRFVIEAPRIARKQKPGQFVILRLYEQGERIPITIEHSDPERGTIRIVVQSAGKTTNLLNSLNAGDSILDVVGPLGKPSEIEKFGTVVVMGGGVGTAMAYPTAAALKQRRQSRDLHRRRAQQGTGHSGARTARGQRCADDHDR